jgi:hypothetical protein
MASCEAEAQVLALCRACLVYATCHGNQFLDLSVEEEGSEDQEMEEKEAEKES